MDIMFIVFSGLRPHPCAPTARTMHPTPLAAPLRAPRRPRRAATTAVPFGQSDLLATPREAPGRRSLARRAARPAVHALARFFLPCRPCPGQVLLPLREGHCSSDSLPWPLLCTLYVGEER